MKNSMKFMMLGLVVGLSALLTGNAIADSHKAPSEPVKMLLERQSPLGFEETLDKLEANAKALGWKVPKKWKVNFQRNLKKVTGTDIGPNQVLKMCEPKAAADLLVNDEYKHLTAMMPCTIAVYVKSDGKTYISMMNLEAMGQMYGGDVAKMTEKLAPEMEQMLKLD